MSGWRQLCGGTNRWFLFRFHIVEFPPSTVWNFGRVLTVSVVVCVNKSFTCLPCISRSLFKSSSPWEIFNISSHLAYHATLIQLVLWACIPTGKQTGGAWLVGASPFPPLDSSFSENLPIVPGNAILHRFVPFFLLNFILTSSYFQFCWECLSPLMPLLFCVQFLPIFGWIAKILHIWLSVPDRVVIFRGWLQSTISYAWVIWLLLNFFSSLFAIMVIFCGNWCIMYCLGWIWPFWVPAEWEKME